MKRTASVAMALALWGIAAGAAEPAGQNVIISRGLEAGSDNALPGYLALPKGKGPFPAVIVVHEWWGLDDWVKQQADALAAAGYVALAPDLYGGKVTNKPEEAHQLMSGLSQDRAVADLKAAYAHLQQGALKAGVRQDRIGVIGWCMGGRYALELAVQEPKLAAVVAYYGAPPTDAAAIARIKAPVLGNFGAEDKGPAPETVRAFEAAMKKAGGRVDVKIYEGAGHAFANVNNPWGGYRKEAAADAWARTLAFFDTHLKKK
jgi:carboxymethylenebutenolidase